VFIKEVTYRATNIKESGEISPPSTNLGKPSHLKMLS